VPFPVQSPPRICFRDFELDLTSGELHKDGQKVPLPPKAFEVLRSLVERPGEVVTRDELRARLWAADTFVEFDDSLNHAVKKLRQALGDSAENPQFIETLPRHGYRFIAPTNGANIPGNAPKPKRRYPVPVIVSALALLALMAALVAYDVGGLRRRLWVRTADDPPIRSLAVLPLSNLTGDPQQDYFADGMTDALITDLAKIRAVKVISRTSVMQFKGVNKPLPEIAQALGVDGILEGSVQRSGGRVRITAQLIRAAEIGTEEGLRFIYAGNLPGRVGPWENTYCPNCREKLIDRYGYLVREYRLTPEGKCPGCGMAIPGIWPATGAAEVQIGQSMADYYSRLPRGVRVN